MMGSLCLALLLVMALSVPGSSLDYATLRRELAGEVVEAGSQSYEWRRTVINKACRNRPLVIVVPKNTEDVSKCVKFATKFGLQISVRSGGHSYTCTSVREGGMHIDLRGLNKVKLVTTSLSPTGLAAYLGPGSTWGRVQSIIPTEYYSYPHGQCKSVGVGGYLLGGGVNWLGTFNKYGYGAESVLRLQVVTANGTIVDVEPGRSTMYPAYPHETKTVVRHSYHNDLFYAMRGAGASYGIATEFLYKINREPETLPAAVMVWVDKSEDLQNIRRAAQGSSKYSVLLATEFVGRFWNNPQTNTIYKLLPGILYGVKVLHWEMQDPVVLSVTDIRPGAPRETDPVAVVEYLRQFGIRTVFEKDLLVQSVNTAFLYIYDLLISEQEVQAPGTWAVGGVSVFAISDSEALEQEFFNNPVLGVLREDQDLFKKLGCNYCAWMIQWRNRQDVPGLINPISTNTDNNAVFSTDTNVFCLAQEVTSSQCILLTLRLKKSLESTLDAGNVRYSKYLNWPSCDSTDWALRYWEDYPRLLKIKEFWDPGNMFHHCQSVGSTDNSCCPFKLEEEV